jgi:hypothetical protein
LVHKNASMQFVPPKLDPWLANSFCRSQHPKARVN